jgi:hypothetical protein
MLFYLNTTVRNEIANDGRGPDAILDHIGPRVIGAAGSADGKQDFTKSLCAARGLLKEDRPAYCRSISHGHEACGRIALPSTCDNQLFDETDRKLMLR